MADVLVAGRGAVMVDGVEVLSMLSLTMGRERVGELLVDILQYRADPNFWDEVLKSLGEEQLVIRQAKADQIMARLKEAWPNEC